MTIKYSESHDKQFLRDIRMVIEQTFMQFGYTVNEY